MENYNLDLHYHSPYAAACSKNITIPKLAQEAKLKGLNLITTADILHPIWGKHVRENVIKDGNNFIYKDDKDKKLKTYFMLGVEVECIKRVHNLLYFRDFEHMESFKKEILKYSSDMEKYGGGRPRLALTSDQLLDIALDFDVPMAPAHAFTPYFGVYAHYDSLKEAYGKNWKKIKFLELGLSADTTSANKVPELKYIKFASFSDSHSPMSFRIGREYVNASLEEPNFDSFNNLLNNKNKNKINYNVGFNPKEGKYNATACRSCGQVYTLEQAESFNWRCVKCKGIIKKGVSDRIKELAIAQGNTKLEDQAKRPEYKYLMPLAQVIQIAIGQKNILHKSVLEVYNKFIKEYTEIDIMQKVPEEKLNKIDEKITKYIMAFRKNLVVFKTGGAGHYGEPIICFSEKEKEEKQKEINENIYIKDFQKKLF